jgi:hypothetical protein
VHDTRVIAGGRPATFRLLSRDVLEVTIPAGVMTLRDVGACSSETAARPRPAALVLASGVETLPGPAGVEMPPTTASGPIVPGCLAECTHRETVDIHVATPYGVSGHLLVPVVSTRDAEGPGTMPAFEAACTLRLTFAAARVTGSTIPQARVDEFYESDCDVLAIRVPRAFIPPSKAELSLVLRDAATGETAATFAFPDPFFDAQGRRYLITGGDLRNFIGDTSRPATDKTLRGAVKPWLDRLLQQGRLAEPGDRSVLTLSAAIVAGQQEVPVGGGITVTCTRRGLTTTEPRESLLPLDTGD